MNQSQYYGNVITLEQIGKDRKKLIKQNYKFDKFLLFSEQDVKIKIGGEVIQNPTIRTKNSNFLTEPNYNKCACIQVAYKNNITFDIMVQCIGDEAYFYVDNEKYSDLDIEVSIFVLWRQLEPLSATILNSPIRWNGKFNNDNTSFRFKLNVNPFVVCDTCKYVKLYSEEELISILADKFSAEKTKLINPFATAKKLVPTQMLFISYNDIFGESRKSDSFRFLNRNMYYFDLDKFVSSTYANRRVVHNTRLDLLWVENDGLYGRVIPDREDVLTTPTSIYLDIFITPTQEGDN